MAKLFEPLRIKDVEFKNRIVVSPMCEYSSEDGFANDWHLVHLGTRAIGGAALVFTEATAVSPEGRISPWDLGIWKDEHIEFLTRIVNFIHRHDSIAGTQLAHAGRKASVDTPWRGGKVLSDEDGGWDMLAPSAVPFREGERVPQELSVDEIRKVIEDFREAAARALKCGFKVVEIHAAHGYLINEFFSPVSNLRTDSYGGSFENRIRIVFEIIEAVQQVWPKSHPLFVRISASEWSDRGWNVDDSVRLAKLLKQKGVDLVDCSSGGNVYRAKIELGPMYQVPFAEKVKKEADIRTGAVGLITTAQQCEEILQSGKADMIFLARQLLRDPYFPLRAAKEMGVDVKWPDQYLRAK
ncbi:MAG: NADPH dehydrogenase NamA [Chitinophagaceae bacterium]|nr:NADPH dehydrogenase NamA [Chitinophagaceae bacterium]